MSTQQTVNLPPQLLQKLKQTLVKESADKKTWVIKITSQDIKTTNHFSQAFKSICQDGIKNVENITLNLSNIQPNHYEIFADVFNSFDILTSFKIDISDYTSINYNFFMLPNLKKLEVSLGTAQGGDNILIGFSLAIQKLKLLESLSLTVGESGLIGHFCEYLGQSILTLKNLNKFSLTILSFNHFQEQYFEKISGYVLQHNQIQDIYLNLMYCNQYNQSLDENKKKIILNIEQSDSILNAKVEFQYMVETLNFPQVNVRKSQLYRIIAFQKNISNLLENNNAMILTDLFY